MARPSQRDNASFPAGRDPSRRFLSILRGIEEALNASDGVYPVFVEMPEPEVSQSELFRNVDQGGEAGPSEVQPEQTEAGPSRIHETIEVAPPRKNPPEPERSQMEEGEIPREEVEDDDYITASSVEYMTKCLLKGNFRWKSMETITEHLFGHSGREGHRTARHKAMYNDPVRERKFVRFYPSLFEYRNNVRGGILIHRAKAYSAYPEEHEDFNGTFLPPLIEEDAVDPQSYAIETLRQRALFRGSCYNMWLGRGS